MVPDTPDGTRRKTGKMGFCTWIVCMGLMIISPMSPASIHGAPPTPYHAEYQIQWHRHRIGHATYDLQSVGTHSYTLRVDTAIRIAWLHYATQEYSRGHWDHRTLQIYPDRYQLLRTQNKRTKQFDLVFDWPAHTVQSTITSTEHTQHAQLPLATGLQDKLSVFLRFAQIYQPHQSHYSLAVADGDQIKTYTIVVQGPVRLSTPLGPLETLHVQGTRQHKVMDFWLLRDQLHLPVQIAETFTVGGKGTLILVALDPLPTQLTH